ncbi:hypothetical protein BCR44DRAFT_1437880 [Catenaria anguillulae PL171]|uniref:Uncharacterized protein n=1 Tax=Catenaria anguillulae PL171 TaxID=765915 RepID=A0A1Y2HIX1_9FUNG|nr:hypothetical protein BCR44DRAFT_1437880 [Catenaria anguillulae PL171]
MRGWVVHVVAAVAALEEGHGGQGRVLTEAGRSRVWGVLCLCWMERELAMTGAGTVGGRWTVGDAIGAESLS